MQSRISPRFCSLCSSSYQRICCRLFLEEKAAIERRDSNSSLYHRSAITFLGYWKAWRRTLFGVFDSWYHPWKGISILSTVWQYMRRHFIYFGSFRLSSSLTPSIHKIHSAWHPHLRQSVYGWHNLSRRRRLWYIRKEGGERRLRRRTLKHVFS